jgi:hypothetical protein
MSEISLEAAGRQVITVRLDPNNVIGRDLAGQPALYLPLQLQLLPAGQNGDVQYTLLRLAGKLLNPPLGEFASFELNPLAAVPNATPFYRQHEAMVTLDRQRIKRFEELRSGKDAYFQIMFSSLLWYPAERKFEAEPSRGSFEVFVPKSHWADKVVSAWNLSNIKVIEIEFPRSAAGENFRVSYARLGEAEKLFTNGQYKQVLTTLRLSFEALAISLGYDNKHLRECFESLFASSHPDKKEKARDALAAIYKFLHLGPHEQVNQADRSGEPVISRQDARFALTMAYTIFEYITPGT